MSPLAERKEVAYADFKKEVLAPKGIESLVLGGRVPTIWYPRRGVGPEGKSHVWAGILSVPPEGVLFGDKVHNTIGGEREFFYAGKSIGLAHMIILTPGEVYDVTIRTDKVLKSLGREKVCSYTQISDKEWLQMV